MKRTFSRNKLLLFIILSLFLAFCFHYVFIKYDQYDYHVAQGYQLTIADAESHSVQIEDGRLFLPKLLDPTASYFLKVDLKTNVFGKIREPRVFIQAGALQEINTFEHGAKGIRYINLTNVVDSGKNEILLKGKYCSIPDQEAQLYECPSPINVEDQLLVVSPHPDDAEIAAFGLYSQYKNVFILTVTMGEAGKFKYDEAFNDSIEHYMKKAELRTWNSIAVPKLGGVSFENTLNLGYFNQSLYDMYQDRGDGHFPSKYIKTDDVSIFHHFNISPLRDSILNAPSWNGLVSNFRMVLRNVKPKTIVTPFPKLDNHKDHKVSSWALFEALRLEGMSDVNLMLYSNHQHHCSAVFPFGDQWTGTTIAPILGEDSIKVSSMASFPLSRKKQGDKLFALEAMHDLRPGNDWMTLKGTTKMFAKKTVKSLYGYEPNYYRRAVRTNELFYVGTVEDLENY